MAVERRTIAEKLAAQKIGKAKIAKFETRNLELETRNLELETRNTELENSVAKSHEKLVASRHESTKLRAEKTKKIQQKKSESPNTYLACSELRNISPEKNAESAVSEVLAETGQKTQDKIQNEKLETPDSIVTILRTEIRGEIAELWNAEKLDTEIFAAIPTENIKPAVAKIISEPTNNIVENIETPETLENKALAETRQRTQDKVSGENQENPSVEETGQRTQNKVSGENQENPSIEPIKVQIKKLPTPPEPVIPSSEPMIPSSESMIPNTEPAIPSSEPATTTEN